MLVGDNGGGGNSQKSDVSDRVKIADGVKRTYPHAFLTGLLEPSVVTLDLSAKSVNFLK